MTAEPHLYVFAYGSNLHERRMRSRVSTASAVTIGYVQQRQLRFHKRSVDGSAKADAAFTAVTSDRVWGVVYRLSRHEKPELDKHEFLGVGYDQELVAVNTNNGSIQAWMYVARRDTIDESLMPYSWYCGYIIAGARQHRLPFCYIGNLLDVETTVDPDFKRHEHNRQHIDMYCRKECQLPPETD
jgi:gamma-glutamylcyclotransferase